MVTFNLLRKELEKDSALSEKNECYFCLKICNAVLLDSRAVRDLTQIIHFIYVIKLLRISIPVT